MQIKEKENRISDQTEDLWAYFASRGMFGRRQRRIRNASSECTT